jgi:hypothetical protein
MVMDKAADSRMEIIRTNSEPFAIYSNWSKREERKEREERDSELKKVQKSC